MRGFLVLFLSMSVATPVGAGTLVSSTEDTPERVCLERTTSPERIVAACDTALASASLTNEQRAEFLVARGDGQFWQNAPRIAVESYRGAIGWNKGSVDAWNGLGWALWESEGHIAAFEAFRSSLDVGVSAQGLGGAAATGRRAGIMENDEARRMLQDALSIDPGYIWAHREIGWSHLEDGDLIASTSAFQSALAIDEDDANALYGLGRATLEMGLADRAFELFEDALGSEPDNFGADVFRITALREMGRNLRAVSEADRLIARYPARASGYVERGRALMALDRHNEALETYVQADRLVGSNNAVLYWHADALASTARFAEALAVIDRGLALDGADYSDYILKSYIALELGNYRMALEAAEASLATGIEDPWAHYYVAIALVHEGDPAAGVQRFKLAIAAGLPPDRAGAFTSELINAGSISEAMQLGLNN